MNETTTPISLDIHPFRLGVSREELEDLHRRLVAARLPHANAGDQTWERGVPPDYLRDLATYWRTGYDWRREEERLNAVPQFRTVIDGQPIHFLHVRSPQPDALPLLLLHSWPGSPVEFARVIGPLTDPAANRGRAEDAFHVVVPALPGFGYSTPVTEAGWTTGRTARALTQLMRGLGYDRYAAHGGDIGAGVAAGLSAADPEGVVAVHVSTDPPTAVSFASWSGDPTANPALTADERARVEELLRRSKDDEGYLRIQATRPQTIGYALTDSPVAQLAWIVEKVQAWTDASAALPEDAVDRDQLLTNVSLYWFTRSGASAAHALYESMHAQEWSEPGPAPTGFAVFGAEPLVRKLMDAEGTITHWTEFARGGHFPATEQPDLLVDDLRAFLRAFRQAD